MRKTIRGFFSATVLAAGVMAAQPAIAAADYAGAPPSAASMGFDLVVARPMGAVSTVLGTGLFVASLPFSLLGWNVDEAARQLVVQPARYTFLRPLGDFEMVNP